MLEVDSNQHFVGFSIGGSNAGEENSIPVEEKNCALATGFGVVFREWWPYKYD